MEGIYIKNIKNKIIKSKSNAFTLIELLAIIVILAIIAVITTPIILNIIDDVSVKSAKNSVYGIIDSAQLHYASQQLNNNDKVPTDTNLLSDIAYNGKEFENYLYYGYGVYLNEAGKVAVALKYNDKCYIKNYDSEEIEIKDFNIADCTIDNLERWDGTSEEITPDGDIYYVENGKQLAWLSDQANSGNTFAGKKVVLVNDINMGAIFDKDGNLLDENSHAFTTIGNSNSNGFAGNFDGNNHKIYNLYINTTLGFTGLFGGFMGTEFKDLILENSYIKTTGNVAGIIGGNVSGYSLNIDNVKSINNIIQGDRGVGGIIGQVFGNITNCYSSSTVTVTDNTAGGIVGLMSGDSLEGNINIGNVTSNSYSAAGIGGEVHNANIKNNINKGNIYGVEEQVAGIVAGASNNPNVENNVNIGNITGDAFLVGGILGYENNGKNVKGNINNGTVQGENKWIGGIVGIHDPSNNVVVYSNNINNGEVKTSKGAARVGGIIGNANKGVIAYNNVNNGNIDGVGNGTTSSYGIGGIIGTFGNDSNTQNNSYLYNNYNKGNVKGKVSVGGIVGNLHSYTTAGEYLKNCLNEGTIEATTGFAGGIVGRFKDGTDNTNYISDYVANSYNKGIVKGANAAGLVGSNIGIKNSITTGTLQGTHNYGVIGNIVEGVNISNVYYPNTYTSSYGTGIDINSLNDTTLGSILGNGFSYNNGASVRKANITVENNEITSITYSSDILR